MTATPIPAVGARSFHTGNLAWAMTLVRDGVENIPGGDSLPGLPKGLAYRLMPGKLSSGRFTNFLWDLHVIREGSDTQVASVAVLPTDSYIAAKKVDGKILKDRLKSRKMFAKRMAKRRKALYIYEPVASSPRGKVLIRQLRTLSIVEFFMQWALYNVCVQAFFLSVYFLLFALGIRDHGGATGNYVSIGISLGAYLVCQVLVQRGVVIREEGLSMHRALGSVSEFFSGVWTVLEEVFGAIAGACNTVIKKVRP